MRKLFTFLAVPLLVSLSILLGRIIFVFGDILIMLLSPSDCSNAAYQSCLQDEQQRQGLSLIVASIYLTISAISYFLIIRPIIIKSIFKVKNYIINSQPSDLSSKIFNQLIWSLILLSIGGGMFLPQLSSLSKNLLQQ